ncbi:MAG TPA: carbohydrate ABC transporter permease [Thermoleophilaceae bacterium]
MATAVPVSRPLVRREVPREIRRRRFLVAVAEHSVLIGLAIAFLAPFVFIVLTSVMTDHQSLSTNLWPQPAKFSNYSQVFKDAPLLTYAGNTFLYATLATVGMLISSVPVAYALACMRWRGRNVVFGLVLVSMMLPPQVTVVPQYVMWSKLHLIGTIWPLVLPNWFGDAFSIFLLRQFFLTIPRDYADAARVDGLGEFRIMASVMTRLARPALVAVALFSFLYAWNDFFGPLLYTGENQGHWTLSVGLAQFRHLHSVQWNLTMAATLLFMAPVIALFFAAQKKFVEGVNLTGVKG